MRFTTNEFDTMVRQLLYSTPSSFEMLCTIAEKTLRPSIEHWYKTDPYLRDRGIEQDIMQEIHVRLMKTTVTHFLLREGIDGPYNNNPEGFEDWMFCVAENIKRDYMNKARALDFKSSNLDDPTLSNFLVSDSYSLHSDEERMETLREAFTLVLSSEVSVYKILTWIAQFLFVLNENVTKIESTQLIVAAFENKTLYDMYDMLLVASEQIPWISITPMQHKKILMALRQKRSCGISYGETTYKSFFMKNKGVVSGKKSISDWVNRMNNLIKAKSCLGNKATDGRNNHESSNV